jgi:putative PIN family toxin of toxin-antitoxin system
MPFVIAVDTNIWVSAFITPHGYPARLKLYWQANRFDVVVSIELLAELAEVLARPRLRMKYGYSSEEVTAYLRLITELANMVKVTGTLNLCRDPDDNVLIETAVLGQATHVVSRDEDIIRDTNVIQYLEKHGIQAMTINRFLSELRTD